MVSDYINFNMRSMIVIGSDAVGTTLAHVTMSPSSDKLRIRLERHNGRLYFDRADFRRHCSANGFDPKAVASELTTKGISQGVRHQDRVGPRHVVQYHPVVVLAA